jgi:hypothetical protein
LVIYFVLSFSNDIHLLTLCSTGNPAANAPVFSPTMKPANTPKDDSNLMPVANTKKSKKSAGSPTPVSVYSAEHVKLGQVCLRNVDGALSLEWNAKKGQLTAERQASKGFVNSKCPDSLEEQFWTLPNRRNYEYVILSVEGTSSCSDTPCTCTLNTKEQTQVKCNDCNIHCKNDPVGAVELMDLTITEVKAYPLASLSSSGYVGDAPPASMMSLLVVTLFLATFLGLFYLYVPKLFSSDASFENRNFQPANGYHHVYRPIPELAE